MRVPAGVHLVAQGHVGHAGHPHVDGLRADARRIRQRDALLLQLDPQARQLHSTHMLRLAASAAPQRRILQQPLLSSAALTASRASDSTWLFLSW